MRYTTDYIVFKTDALYKDKMGMFYLDTAFDSARHTKNWGIVVSVPKRLSADRNLMTKGNGIPAPTYDVEEMMEVKHLSDVEMVIEPGDKVYFHYNTIQNIIREPHRVLKEVIEEGKKWYYVRLRYDQVFCAVRGGEIIPVASWVFVRPDMESWDDILIPVPVIGANGKPILNHDGTPKMKPKEQWLAVKSMPDKKYLLGFVEAIGAPLKGHVCDMKAGDKIVYTKFADFVVQVEGKDYFLIKQGNILAVIEEEIAG